MDGTEIFLAGLAAATKIVKQVLPEHLTLPTPDTEWNVRDLVGHMLYELSWVPDIMAGKIVTEVGDAHDGDLFDEDDGRDLATAWEQAAMAAETSVNDADPEETAHVSYGDVTIDDYLREAGNDQLIHAWDLGKAIGMPIIFDESLAKELYESFKGRQQELQRSGLFAPPLQVPDTADNQTKLLALLGRDADWKPEKHISRK